MGKRVAFVLEILIGGELVQLLQREVAPNVSRQLVLLPRPRLLREPRNRRPRVFSAIDHEVERIRAAPVLGRDAGGTRLAGWMCSAGTLYLAHDGEGAKKRETEVQARQPPHVVYERGSRHDGPVGE